MSRPFASTLSRIAALFVVPVLCASLAACSSNSVGPAVDAAAVPVDDMAVSVDMAPSICATLGMTALAWNDGTPGTLRDTLAGDFTVTDQNGDWNFKQSWSGCESYVFIPDNIAASSTDPTSIWANDLDALVAASPSNVHYFFISKSSGAAISTALDQLRTQVDTALAPSPDGSAPGQKDWWRAHLHFVTQGSHDLTNWVGAALRVPAASSPLGAYGFAIDRFQQLRGVGSYADVNRSDPANQNWPFDNNLAYAANPPVYFNYEADRQAKINAEPSPTVLTIYDHEVVTTPQPPAIADGGASPDLLGQVYPPVGTVWKDVTFPDAATMQTFDTLEVDLTMNCPQTGEAEENNNCGAWDYIVNISFLGDDGQTWNEMARFISSYHRAGRYFVDASHFLPYLAKGGVQHMQYAWAPPWNEQPALTTMQFRLSNKGSGMHPAQAAYLFAGGSFDTMYDPQRSQPVTVMIPLTAKKVELRALITGHGSDSPADCSEFCDHHHEFTVGGMIFTKTFPDIGDDQGCMEQINTGAVPNQSGTWWYGRGGWCPGMQVDPWVVDVTALATPGKSLTITYRGLFNGKPPTQSLGTIDMNSWLVIWE